MTHAIPHYALRNGRQRPDAPAYAARADDGWEYTTWGDYADEVRRAARALIALGLEPGGAVAVLGFNRPEWVIFDLAAMAAGGLPAGIYATSSSEECAYILNHSEARIALVENETQLAKIRRQRGRLPHLRHIVAMRGASDRPDRGLERAPGGATGRESGGSLPPGPAEDPEGEVIPWDAFLACGDRSHDPELEDRLDGLRPEDPASLIYTSGTTGLPKAVVLSHDNLSWTARTAAELFDLGGDERSLSYLPLSHIAEQMFSIHAPAVLGSCVHYVRSVDRLADDLAEVRPTYFFAVPRVWEKFRAGVESKLAEATGPKARLVRWAREVGRSVVDLRTRGERPGPVLAARYAVAERLAFGKVKRALGLDRCRLAASGAAPISPDVLEFFASLDLLIYEVYGQSEGSGPTTVNRPGRTRLGSVGVEFPGTEVRLADDGEILVRGRQVFLGYHKDPTATARALRAGWLHSGDLGRVDEDGFFWITGRKKDVIITAGGKNISPAAIERRLTDSPLIANAVVVGDRRPYLTALVALEPDEVDYFLTVRGLSGPAGERPELLEAVQEIVGGVNAEFARAGQIKRFALLPRPLAIERGELTPTLKVRRAVVEDRYARLIDGLYEE